MARGSGSNNQKVIPQAYHALNQFKYEVANELGINADYKSGYWGNISSRECGAVGGHMVRRMIAAAEQSLVDQARGSTQGYMGQGQGASFPLEPDAQQGTTNAHNPNEQQSRY